LTSERQALSFDVSPEIFTMPPSRDDPATREERLADMIEEFRTRDRSFSAVSAAATANARVARDRAVDVHMRAADASARAYRASRRALANSPHRSLSASSSHSRKATTIV
jgi:hypothetical protein